MSTWFSHDPNLRREVAGSAPQAVWTTPLFWWAQKWFSLVICIGIVGIYYLAPLTYNPADQWFYLVIATQLIAVWGASITVVSLAKIAVEMAVVEEVEERGEQHLREIRSGEKDRISPDQMADALLPDNPSQPAPAMIRLFRQICKEAKDHRFEASVTIIQPYREESLEPLFKLQNLQKIALWLGILGTFIGLLLAIGARNVNPVQRSEDFMAVIDQMFQSLSLSFSASLAGLEVAIILGFFLLLIRQQQETYFQNMETAVVTMLSLARHAQVDDNLLNDLKQVTTAVQQMNDRVFDQSAAVRSQTQEIQQGVQGLINIKVEFDSFLTQISEKQKEFIGDLNRLYDTVSLKNIEGELQQSILKAGQEISSALAPAAQISKQLGTFNQSAQSLINNLPRQLDKVSEITQLLEHIIKEQADENKRFLERLIKNQAAENTKSFEKLVKTLVLEHSKAVATLGQGLKKNSSRKNIKPNQQIPTEDEPVFGIISDSWKRFLASRLFSGR
jgi:biopolymer transport protein ExbB/TolQ